MGAYGVAGAGKTASMTLSMVVDEFDAVVKNCGKTFNATEWSNVTGLHKQKLKRYTNCGIVEIVERPSAGHRAVYRLAPWVASWIEEAKIRQPSKGAST